MIKSEARIWRRIEARLHVELLVQRKDDIGIFVTQARASYGTHDATLASTGE
jgi:hypothetical protein